MSTLDGRNAPGGDHMKRPIWAALGVVIVALALPAAALATHHHRSAHSFRHHGGHGLIHRGPTGATGASGNSVTSYSDGKLVLALADGDSLSGLVTDQTRFSCIGEGWGGNGGGRQYGRGGRYNDGRGYYRGSTGSTGTTGWSGSTGTTGTTGWSGKGGPSGRRGWGGKGSTGTTGPSGYTPPPPCDSSLLSAGASVYSAEVAITNNGVLFSEIVLLPAVQ